MSRDLALAMVLLKYVTDQVMPALKELREQGKRDLVPGEKAAAVGPDGTVYGFITRTKSSTVAVVVDEAQLMAHLQETQPDALVDATCCDGDRYDEVIAVLREHAPHLVRSYVGIEPRALRSLLLQVECRDVPPPPGVELREKPGTVAVYPDTEKAEQIEQAVRSGLVSLDGTLRIEGER